MEKAKTLTSARKWERKLRRERRILIECQLLRIAYLCAFVELMSLYFIQCTLFHQDVITVTALSIAFLCLTCIGCLRIKYAEKKLSVSKKQIERLYRNYNIERVSRISLANVQSE